MRTRPSLLWILAMALLLILGPVAALWWLTGRQGYCSIDRFMPDRLSAALRVTHAESAWRRHWLSRRGPAPEDALQRIMEVIDEWPSWVKKHGEAGSRIRLTLYQKALFHALGDDAWLIFGEWGCGERPGTGQVGLVILLRGDSSVKSRVGQMMDLLLDDYLLERSQCEGVPVYEFKSKKESRSLTFCQVGGWICTSLRQRGAGPLPLLIRQVRQAGDAGKLGRPARPIPEVLGKAELSPLALDGAKPADNQTSVPSALTAVAYPKLFWEQIRQFTLQREHKISKGDEHDLKSWRRRFEGVDRMVLAQSGDSLFDLRLVLEGLRPAQLGKQLKAEAAGQGRAGAANTSVNTSASTRLASASAAAPASHPPGGAELAQLDMSLPFARLSLPLAGLSWDDLLRKNKGLDYIAQNLRPLLLESLSASSPIPGEGRIGLAVYPSQGSLIPGIFFWKDRQILMEGAAGAPARSRAARLAKGTPCEPEDWSLWIPPLGFSSAAQPAHDQHAWNQFEDQAWARKGELPLAFMAMDFQGLADELQNVPTLFMKKKKRKEFKRWEATFQALAMSVGGVALRLDDEGNRWILTSQTP